MTSIRAAGGVVWRPSDAGVEVCLVHRPRYDDWSIPKGKLEPGEHPLVAAVREVAEETDVRAVPQVRLPQVCYATRDGSPKVVDYWSMRAVDTGGFEIHTEVDAVRWLPVDEAVGLVSYVHDVRVLRDFATLPPVTAVLAVVRHGDAVEPDSWSGPDAARPLGIGGLAQARSLAPLLALTRPRRLLSATARRCVQTLDPLASLLDLPIEVDSAFDEPEVSRDTKGGAATAAARIVALAASGRAAVACGQGKLICDALARLAGGRPDYFATPRGTGWLLAFGTDRLIGTDRLTAAVS